VKAGAIRAVPGTAQAPPLWRTVVIVIAALVLVATAMVGMRLLAG
jgi:hypothetical protein